LRFARNILIAVLPSQCSERSSRIRSTVISAPPAIVGWALIAGGIAILAIERTARPGADVGVADLPLKTVIGIGLAHACR
jgi:undecaprenyl-diphosphatase